MTGPPSTTRPPNAPPLLNKKSCENFEALLLEQIDAANHEESNDVYIVHSWFFRGLLMGAGFYMDSLKCECNVVNAKCTRRMINERRRMISVRSTMMNVLE